jgi:hypothetical protein
MPLCSLSSLALWGRSKGREAIIFQGHWFSPVLQDNVVVMLFKYFIISCTEIVGEKTEVPGSLFLARLLESTVGTWENLY